METVLAFLAQHWETFFAVIGILVTAASAIVKLTPTDRDDLIVAKVVKFLDWFSVVNPRGTFVLSQPKA